MCKKIVLLGSTGSIGRQALQVIDAFPDKFKIVGLAAGTNLELLQEQVKKYKPEYLAVAQEEGAKKLLEVFPKKDCYYGQDGLVNLAQLTGIDLVIVAVTGIVGLLPTLAALENGIPVALANKETIVAGGALVMAKGQEKGVPLIPVDSEHSAIFQCLEDNNLRAVEKLILTASGGPFLNFSPAQIKQVTPELALQHPKWQMGAKITIDSAGLINKGLEVIEAHWLFNVPYENIEVVIHPQSIIHSLVAYQDGSVLAQLGQPDMKVPIQYAMTYPERWQNNFPRLSLFETKELTFEKPDLEKFPGLKLAYEAGITGGTMTAVYNGANEVAVELFLAGKISFMEIPQLIAGVMEKHPTRYSFTLEDLLEADQWARQTAYNIFI